MPFVISPLEFPLFAVILGALLILTSGRLWFFIPTMLAIAACIVLGMQGMKSGSIKKGSCGTITATLSAGKLCKVSRIENEGGLRASFFNCSRYR